MGYHETLIGNTKRGNGDQYKLVKKYLHGGENGSELA